MVAQAVDDDAAEEVDLAATDLDELSHSEMLTLYTESATTLRFAKLLQWRTVAGAVLLMIGLLVFASVALDAEALRKWLAFASFLIGPIAIFMLAIFQVWQQTEREKLAMIGSRMSSLFRQVRGLTSAGQASVHRYMLLAFMIVIVATANAIVYLGITRLG